MKKNYGYGGEMWLRRRGLKKREKHMVRSDLDIEEHYRAMREVRTGGPGAIDGGKGLMYP